MLLEFPEIQKKLEKLFDNIPEDIKPDCTDLCLKSLDSSFSILDEVETRLEVRLPNSFRETILHYDFGNLTLGGIWFGVGKDKNYAHVLVESNDDEEQNFMWWGNGRRPKNYVMIASSDGSILWTIFEVKVVTRILPLAT